MNRPLLPSPPTRRRAATRALLTLLLGLALLIVTSATALAAPAPWAKGGPSRPEDLHIKLVTFGPGNQMASWFGHTAIAVEDDRLNSRRIYNYGMFSFDAAVVPKYAMGRLEFWVAPTHYQGTLDSYAREDRDVRLLELNLSPDKRAEVAAFLEDNITPEKRHYLYHHYYDNCATRIRDIIDDATDGQFKKVAQATPPRMSLRDHTRRHALWGIIDFGMMYAMSAAIDAPITAWDEMFLPVEFEQQVKNFKYTNAQGELVPIAGEEEIYATATVRPQTPDAPVTLWPWLFLWGALAAAGGAAFGWLYVRFQSRLWRVLYGLYNSGLGFWFGGAGILLTFMWLGTDHTVTYRNENLFWTNPVTFLLWPVGLMYAFGSGRAKRWLSKLWLACLAIALIGQPLKLLPWFDQDTSLTVALCAPMLLGMALVSRMVEKKLRQA